MQYQKLASFLLTSITAGLAAALVLLVLRPDLVRETEQTGMTTVPVQATPALPRESGPYSYAAAVSKAAPSVVNIYTAKLTTQEKTLQFRDPVMQYFFGNLLPEQRRKRLETNLGSGVVINPDGYILTNHHVVKAADEIKVVLASGRNIDVSVVGSDPDTDLAVLKADKADLPTITVGDSKKMLVGDVVLAIGNPFGVGQTVTMGIVSGLGRDRLGINTFENFIQTDAAINPGNSGGALINAKGELVGINTAIFSQSGASHGIGFAIPIDLAKGIMDQIIRKGRVVRGWLGISGQNVTEELAESFGLHNDKGILISEILEDSPADLAGLRPGDVITQINGRKLEDIEKVLTIITNAGPGSELALEIWRGNKPFTVVAITTERPVTR